MVQKTIDVLFGACALPSLCSLPVGGVMTAGEQTGAIETGRAI
jgi:hypothetical protein